jgi:hypothetical protein
MNQSPITHEAPRKESAGFKIAELKRVMVHASTPAPGLRRHQLVLTMRFRSFA